MKIFSLAAIVVLLCLPWLVVIAEPSRSFESAIMGQPPTDAAQLYARQCVKCHGKDGRAKGLKAKAVGARNLTDSLWQDRVTDERLFNSINNGKRKMPVNPIKTTVLIPFSVL